MTSTLSADRLASLLRSARTADLLPPATVDFGPARRLDATAFVLPGARPIRRYLETLARADADIAAWDGRVEVLERDELLPHRVVIVDRYGQVYEATDAEHADALPDAHALEEWFRFLATACPECGVLDDPRERSWTP